MTSGSFARPVEVYQPTTAPSSCEQRMALAWKQALCSGTPEAGSRAFQDVDLSPLAVILVLAGKRLVRKLVQDLQPAVLGRCHRGPGGTWLQGAAAGQEGAQLTTPNWRVTHLASDRPQAGPHPPARAASTGKPAGRQCGTHRGPQGSTSDTPVIGFASIGLTGTPGTKRTVSEIPCVRSNTGAFSHIT